MKIIDLRPDFILDNDTETEVINTNLHYKDIPNGMFYSKNRYLKRNFKGDKIECPDDYIRVKSIWHIDFKNKTKAEVVPFGEFDVNEAVVMGEYLYFTKIIDKDNDGLLKDDYIDGEIYRIDVESLKVEYCCDIAPYNFHGFEMATEQYVIFRSEDQIPDIEEIVFIDLKNKKKAVLEDNEYWDSCECMDYRFIFDENQNPIFVMTKRFVNEGDCGSEEDKLMCFEWKNFLNHLEWHDIK